MSTQLYSNTRYWVNEYVTENMIDQDGAIEGSWRRNIDDNSAFQEIGRCGTNNTS